MKQAPACITATKSVRCGNTKHDVKTACCAWGSVLCAPLRTNQTTKKASRLDLNYSLTARHLNGFVKKKINKNLKQKLNWVSNFEPEYMLNIDIISWLKKNMADAFIIKLLVWSWDFWSGSRRLQTDNYSIFLLENTHIFVHYIYNKIHIILFKTAHFKIGPIFLKSSLIILC